MTVETALLVWGSAAIGFAPLLCFFFQITFPKSQLIIVFITSAFFFLLAGLSASLLWYIFDPVIGLGNAWSAIIPGVFFQFLFRCMFVALYHKVEAVIESSIAKTEEQLQTQDDDDSQAPDLDAAKLRLELNDVASGVAAGTGFGGMHAIIMFGSLLAFETADLGVLFQPSCPAVPSLVVSALNCFFFYFLDIFWMLLTFYGMRRRLIFPRGGGTLSDIDPRRRQFGAYFGNTRTGGNMALITVLISHFLASSFTTFNHFQYGCVFSLSLVPAVLIVVAYLFWSGVSKIYSPLPHSNVRLSLPASFSYGSNLGDDAIPGDDERDAVQRARDADDD